MEIGFFFWPYHVALVCALAEAADTLGYDMVGIADTPGIAMDPWVATTLLAEGTQRARVAVCVTTSSWHLSTLEWKLRPLLSVGLCVSGLH